MTLAPLMGKAGIWFGNPRKLFKLRVPLQGVRPAFRRRRYVVESLDYSNREIVNIIGTGGAVNGVHELVGTLRYEDDPLGLVEMLAFGMDGGELEYCHTDYDVAGVLCALVEPSGDLLDVLREEDRTFKEYALEIRLRRTDGGIFTGVF